MLTVAADIDAHHLAVLEIFDESAHAIGKSLGIHAAGPGTPSLRKYQQRVFAVKEVRTLIKGLFHLIPVASAVDGNAFAQITENRQDDIALKVVSFRQIPGD
jgi:hypothetical protein